MSEFKNSLRNAHKVYSGDNIVKYLLKELGVAEKIASNPHVIEKVSIIVCELMEQKNIKIEGITTNWNVLKGECTEDEISQILKLLRDITYELGKGESELRKQSVPDKDKIDNEANGNRLGYNTKYGITVDLKGRFSIQQQITLPSGNDETISTTFGLFQGESSSIVENISRRNGFQTNIINSLGIVMKRKWREDGNEMAEMIRMEEDPTVASVRYQGKTYYYWMNADELADMMGSTTNFVHGQMRTKRMSECKRDTLQDVRETDEYKSTLFAMSKGKEYDRFSSAIQEMCIKAGLKMFTLYR